MYIAIIGILVAALTERYWLALLAVGIGMPAAWLFNLRCPSCAWLVYRVHGTAKKHPEDQLLAPLYSKIRWKLPDGCSKCGLKFESADHREKPTC